MSSIFSELKRRNVFRVAGVYAVVGWLLVQMAAVLENSLNMPGWFDTVVVSFLLIGFPIAMILAWAFEMTPEGFKKTEAVQPGESVAAKTASILDMALVGGLAIVGILIVGDRLAPKAAIVPGGSVVAAGGVQFAGQSIAVLPFEDFSPGKDQEYFADGIAEELLNVLARVEGLRVASRTSAFSYKGREASIAEIGAALNVTHILEGSVRKAGDTLRITAQLIDTKTDEHMWSETYDRPLTAENIFEIQDEISKAIVLELNGRLDLLPETATRATQSTEALEAYLKGKEAYAPRNAEGVETGLTELIRAVTLDPDFAVAHAKLARAYALATEYSDLDKAYAYPRAEIHMARALALAPNDWDVLAEHAWLLEAQRSFADGDATFDQVIAAFDVAIAANPNNAEAHRGKGWILSKTDRLADARASLERARELNPRDPLIYLNLTNVARSQGDQKEVLDLATEAVRQNPSALYSRASLGAAYSDLGDVEMAHRIFQSCRIEPACASYLGSMHLELGIDVTDPRLLDEYSLLSKAYLAGDKDAFAKTVAALDGPTPRDKVGMYAVVGRWDEGYKVIEENPAEFEALFKGLTEKNNYTISSELALLETLERKSDPRAKAVRASLAKHYSGVVPSENAPSDTYTNGARWRMLNDDPDGAMVWLNALAGLGRPQNLDNVAIVSSLKPRADFQAFSARMEAFRTRDRALIEAQLANPPQVWWSPDELEETAP